MFAQVGFSDVAERQYDDLIKGDGSVSLILHQIQTYTYTNLLSQAVACLVF